MSGTGTKIEHLNNFYVFQVSFVKVIQDACNLMKLRILFDAIEAVMHSDT